MLELNRDSFNELISGPLPALVDFWAPWCMPCKIFGPVLANLESEFAGRVTFAKLNTDNYGDLAAKYDITSIPAVILFKNGEPVERMVGISPRREILDMLEKHI